MFSFFIENFITNSLSDVPSSPSAPTVSDTTASSMTLSWSPPKSDGGTPITGYTIERKDKFSSRWSKVTKEPVTETTFKVSNLKEGEDYQFRVTAENIRGTGQPGDACSFVTAKHPYGKSSK